MQSPLEFYCTVPISTAFCSNPRRLSLYCHFKPVTPSLSILSLHREPTTRLPALCLQGRSSSRHARGEVCLPSACIGGDVTFRVHASYAVVLGVRDEKTAVRTYCHVRGTRQISCFSWAPSPEKPFQPTPATVGRMVSSSP